MVQNGIIWFLVFLFSTTLHEGFHAFASYFLGDKTAFKSGQASLSPIPHIKREPVGMIVAPILSFILGGWMFGWASTPYDFLWAQKYPKKAGLMSAAGPAANLLIVLFSAALIHLGIYLDVFAKPESVNFIRIVSAETGIYITLAKFLSIAFSLNLILFIFNLFPIPPLDGSGIITIFLKEDVARKIQIVLARPGAGLFGIILAWNLFDLVFVKVFIFALNLLYPGSHYG